MTSHQSNHNHEHEPTPTDLLSLHQEIVNNSHDAFFVKFFNQLVSTIETYDDAYQWQRLKTFFTLLNSQELPHHPSLINIVQNRFSNKPEALFQDESQSPDAIPYDDFTSLLEAYIEERIQHHATHSPPPLD
jgi:hypothetical protein